MTDYSFVTIWRVDAPIDDAWDAINQTERMPDWWKYVESVAELEPGDEKGIGRTYNIVWSSALPYKLRFDVRVTRVEQPHLIELAAKGELNGTGLWQLSQEGPVTTIRYDWNVTTTKRWMNVLAPLLRPVFAWNHDVLMNEGGKSLAQLLNARLLNARLLNEPEQKTIHVPQLLRSLMIATGVATLTYVIWAPRRHR